MNFTTLQKSLQVFNLGYHYCLIITIYNVLPHFLRTEFDTVNAIGTSPLRLLGLEL